MARERGNDDGSGTGAMTGSTLWWGAGGLILLVLIGLVWVLINRGGSTPAAVATHTVTAPAPTPSGAGSHPATSAPTSPSTSASNASGCHVPGGNTLVPTTAIPATWQLVGSLAAPVSLSAGPKLITGPGGTLRSCYQDSPTGAVIAAMNIGIAGTTSNALQATELGYTSGPGKVAAEQLPADASNATLSAFSAQACGESACLVKIVFTVQGSYVEQTMPMIWFGGDWKVNGQVTGVANAVEVTSLSPYIAMTANGSSS